MGPQAGRTQLIYKRIARILRRWPRGLHDVRGLRACAQGLGEAVSKLRKEGVSCRVARTRAGPRTLLFEKKEKPTSLVAAGTQNRFARSAAP